MIARANVLPQFPRRNDYTMEQKDAIVLCILTYHADPWTRTVRVTDRELAEQLPFETGMGWMRFCRQRLTSSGALACHRTPEFGVLLYTIPRTAPARQVARRARRALGGALDPNGSAPPNKPARHPPTAKPPSERENGLRVQSTEAAEHSDEGPPEQSIEANQCASTNSTRTAPVLFRPAATPTAYPSLSDFPACKGSGGRDLQAISHGTNGPDFRATIGDISNTPRGGVARARRARDGICWGVPNSTCSGGALTSPEKKNAHAGTRASALPALRANSKGRQSAELPPELVQALAHELDGELPADVAAVIADAATYSAHDVRAMLELYRVRRRERRVRTRCGFMRDALRLNYAGSHALKRQEQQAAAARPRSEKIPATIDEDTGGELDSVGNPLDQAGPQRPCNRPRDGLATLTDAELSDLARFTAAHLPEGDGIRRLIEKATGAGRIREVIDGADVFGLRRRLLYAAARRTPA